jgi:hypothetical protein
LAKSSSFISGTTSSGRREPCFRVSISPFGTGEILPVGIDSKNEVILLSSVVVNAREDGRTACELSFDSELRINCGVAIGFDMIESRQRGIVATLAKDIVESVQLSCGDDGRFKVGFV